MATPSLNDILGEWKIVDESLGMDLPDVEPDMYQPPTPAPPPPSPPALPMDELITSIEAKVERAAMAAREHLLGPTFAHLPNVQLDWTLEGQYVCRVVGMKCHGKDCKQRVRLRTHLHSKGHLVSYKLSILQGFYLVMDANLGQEHNAELAATQAEPASSSSVPEPPTPVATAAEMVLSVEVMDVDSEIPAERAIDTTHSATEEGDGKSRVNATKRPRLALDAIIPDSDGEDEEDILYHEPSPKRLRRSARVPVKRRQF
ncbi:hypothetical protein IL306_008391 [Fusarium sp. DS 682]|nr:hypothetical protein IL306_008391 [Fusarium sp. DS 682]